ncbi:MAG: TonB-dependent receptor [Novosphingobium sp.]|nr:TonB-dependent receptor [Novosphingobium sp.]
MTDRRIGGLLLASCAAMLGTSPVFAQVDEPGAASGTGDEIVVTARKRVERIADVPIAISAFRGDDLANRGVSSVSDLASISPGVSIREDVAGRASPSIVIRGVGFDDFRPNGSPAAAVHVNEVYLGSNALIGGALFDVDRLEILKGPQGTLYGRNTTAGAVNIITRKPGDFWEGNAAVEYGRFDRLRLDAGIGGPLSDSAGIRIAGTYQRGGGFLTNLGTAAFAGTSPVPGVIPDLPLVGVRKNIGDADYGAVRGTIVLSPGETTEITLQANYGRDRGQNSQSDVLGRSATGFTEPDTDPYTYYGNLLPAMHSDQAGVSAKLVQDIGGDTSMTALFAYQHLDRRYAFDPGDPRRTFDLDYSDRLNQYTAELRFNGKLGGLADWTAGAFYFRDRIAFGSLMDASDLVRTVFETDYRQKRSSWAVFGESDVHLTDRLTATLGLRYTSEKSRFSGATIDLNPYGASFGGAAFPGVPAIFDNRFKDDNLSGRALLSYKPIHDLMVYASVSRGFKSGGFDGSTIFSVPEALPFASEKVTAYEIGVKWYSANLPVTFTASTFYYDFRGLQANSVRQIGPVTTSVRTNVAKAEIYGGEAELSVKPVDDLTIRGAVSLLHSKVSDFVSSDPVEVARREGNRLPDAPRVSWNLNASYAIHLGGEWTATPYGEVNHVGKMFKELDNFVSAPSYTLVNTRLTFAAPDERFSFGLFGRNLTKEVYFVGLIPAANAAGVVSGVQRIVGAPRTYGVFAGVKF